MAFSIGFLATCEDSLATGGFEKTVGLDAPKEGACATFATTL